MAFLNGRIPLASLGRTKTGHRLRADAAASYDRMDTAFRRDMGYALAITDAYRDLVAQYAVKALKGFLAATPGKSNHGWGLALDLASGVNISTHPAHRWMDEHAHEYGWVNPAWAQTWKFEPWHWEYVPHLDRHAGAELTARPATGASVGGLGPITLTPITPPQEVDPMSTPEVLAALNALGSKLDTLGAKVDALAVTARRDDLVEVIGIPIDERDRKKGQHFYIVNWENGTRRHVNSRQLTYLKNRGRVDVVEWQPTSTVADLTEIKKG